MNKLQLSLFGLLLLTAASCGGNNKEEKAADKETQPKPQVSVKTRTIDKRADDCNGETCSYVKMELPVLSSENPKLNEAVERYTSEYLQQLFKENLQEPQHVEDPELMAEKFLEGYELFKIEFPDSEEPWFLEVDGSKHFVTEDYFTLYLIETDYLGGAHPNHSTNIQSFSLKTGEKVEVTDVVNKDELLKLAEQKFRKAKRLAPDADLNENGFIFEDNKFALPQNMGFAPGGIVLHYNHYEVAPHADGATDILIMFSEFSAEEKVS